MWTIVHAFHVLAFLGCSSASGLKLRILVRGVLDRASLQSLRTLDKISASSTGIIILTGAAMIAFQPGVLYVLEEPVFWVKLGVFAGASMLVFLTKIFLWRAPALAAGAAIPRPGWLLIAIGVDFVSILGLAVVGFTLVHGGS